MITESQRDIQDLLDKGWKVISVTAQHISIGGAGQAYSPMTGYGKFCFILERG